MRSRNKRWAIWMAAFLVAAYVGCRGEDTADETEPPPGQAAPGDASAKVKPSAANKTRVEKPPPPPTIPKVLLLEADREKCLVWVDDPMPEAELPDLTGTIQSVRGLAGQKLTVVFFWTRGTSELSPIAARNALEDLQKDVFEPYREKGVQVIGINVGDTAEIAGQLIREANVTFPNLLDTDGAFFAKVATEKLPRPYLLDAEGKVLWFDLEFSRTTRDKLMQGIQVALGEIGGK